MTTPQPPQSQPPLPPPSKLQRLLPQLICWCFGVLLIGACSSSDRVPKAAAATAAADAPSAVPGNRRPVSFVRDVKPILELRCLSCHRGATPSGFSLESPQRAFAAGSRGPRIRPGSPDKSLLFIYSATLDGTVVMPMVGERLSNREGQTLRQWIEEGAQWPDGRSGLLHPVDTNTAGSSAAEADATRRSQWIKLDFIPRQQRWSRLRSGIQELRVPKGAYGIEGHGGPRHMLFRNGQMMSAAELAGWVRRDRRFGPNMPVYLFACETGKGRHPFAQDLADELRVPVIAPTEMLWRKRNGGYLVSGSRRKALGGFIPYGDASPDPGAPGEMKTFLPRTSPQDRGPPLKEA